MKTSRHSPRSPKRTALFVTLGILIAAAAGGGLWYASHRTKPTSDLAASAGSQHAAPLQPTAAECIAKLPLNFLTGQVLMIGLPAEDMSAQTAMFAQDNIGGAVLMTAPADPNDGSIGQFKTGAGSLGVPLLVSTDEEGGDIQRFASLGALPAPQDAATSLSPAQAQQLIVQHGVKLKAVGIDMVLGPLADVAPAGSVSPLGNRVFSSDPSVVSIYALAYVNGWQAAGLLPTIKHFPGLGSATGNTDFVPATTPPLSALQQRDFVPYIGAMAHTGTAVMVGNQNVPGWFEGPASLSPTVDSYLRGTLGYQNDLIVTDSLSAAAITNVISESDAAVKAIAAGNDIAMIVELPNSTLAQNEALLSQTQAALQKAIQTNVIPRQQLEQSVLRKLAVQHISACSIKTE